MSARDEELKKELGAAVEARKELGDEYESALVESFLAKLDARVDSQVEQRVRRSMAERTVDQHRKPEPKRRRHEALPYVSLVFAVPLSAIAAEGAGLLGLLACWAGILGINVAHAWPPHLWAPWARRGERPAEWEND